MFTSLWPAKQIVFVRPEIAYPSPGSVCFHGVMRNASRGQKLDSELLARHRNRKREMDGSLKVLQLRVMVHETIRKRSGNCFVE